MQIKILFVDEKKSVLEQAEIAETHTWSVEVKDSKIDGARFEGAVEKI